MNHWIIAPIVLPAIMAPILLMAARHDVVLARIFSIASSVALLGIALTVAACNTVRGAARDVNSVANCTENTINGQGCH